MRKRFIDKSTYATSQGSITISHKKLKDLRPDLYGIIGWIKGIRDTVKFGFSERRIIKEHIFYGDSQPAIVISIDPLLIVAYSDDLDCVVPLKFKDDYVELYKLEVGTKLISINTYRRGLEYQRDIIPGPNRQRWVGFCPIIAEFISDDTHIIERKKEEISKDLWNYVWKMGQDYIKEKPNVYRDGIPIYSGVSAL